MPRNLHKDDTEGFRIVTTTSIDGAKFTTTFGIYHNLATARGMITREKKNFLRHQFWRGRSLTPADPTDSFSAIIEKTPLFWEWVETVS